MIQRILRALFLGLLWGAMATYTAPALSQTLPVDLAPNLTLVFQHTLHGGRGSQQCGGTGYYHVPAGQFSRALTIDTSTDWGGCSLKIGVQDPNGIYQGAKLFVTEGAVGGDGRCGVGIDHVPVPVSTSSDTNWMGDRELIFDTDDNRRGPCVITFEVNGAASNFSLYIKLSPTNPYDHVQCVLLSDHANMYGTKASFAINTDESHDGGCDLQLGIFPGKDPIRP